MVHLKKKTLQNNSSRQIFLSKTKINGNQLRIRTMYQATGTDGNPNFNIKEVFKVRSETDFTYKNFPQLESKDAVLFETDSWPISQQKALLDLIDLAPDKVIDKHRLVHIITESQIDQPEKSLKFYNQLNQAIYGEDVNPATYLTNVAFIRGLLYWGGAWPSLHALGILLLESREASRLYYGMKVFIPFAKLLAIGDVEVLGSILDENTLPANLLEERSSSDVSNNGDEPKKSWFGRFISFISKTFFQKGALVYILPVCTLGLGLYVYNKTGSVPIHGLKWTIGPVLKFKLDSIYPSK